MSSESITLLTFVATALFAGITLSTVYNFAFHYPQQIRDRFNDLAGNQKPQVTASIFTNLEGDRVTFLTRIRQYIEQSGANLSLVKLTGMAVALAIAGATITGLVTRNVWLSIFAAVPGLFAPAAYVVMKRRHRVSQLVVQLPAAFDAISRAVRAGQTVPAAFQIIANEFETPIADEFRCCYEQQKLGMSQETVLRNLAKRTGVMELQIFVLGLLLQSRSGGSLVELLDNLSGMVRKRIKFQQRVRALTGEGRMQALVLTLLPIVAFIGLQFLAPDYIGTLMRRPWLLVATVSAQFVGMLWIRQCVNFEV